MKPLAPGPQRPRRGPRLLLLVALVAAAALWAARSDFGRSTERVSGVQPTAVADDAGEASSSAGLGGGAPAPPGVPEELEGSGTEPAPLVALAARVLDALGRPVVGARAAIGSRDGRVLARAESDEGGLVLLRPERALLGEGAVLVVARNRAVHWRPAPLASEWLGDLALSAPAAIEGTLCLPDGTPAPGVELRSRRVVLDGDASGVATELLELLRAVGEPPAAPSAVTDPLGRFELRGLTPGQHLLEARVHGDGDWARLWIASHAASLVTARVAPRSERLSIEALLVEVVATDRDGEPMGSATVSIAGTGPDGDAFELQAALDPERGDRLLLLPAAGVLDLVATGAGGLAAARRVDLGDEPTGVVRVDLRAAGIADRGLLRGRALGPDGQLLASTVDLWRVDGRGAREPLDVAPDGEGWIALDPGRYRLRIEAAGDRDPRHPHLALPYAPAELELDLSAGEARDLELPVWAGQRLVLTLSAAPHPITGARPRVERVEVLEPGGWRRLAFYEPENGARRAAPELDRAARSWRPVDPASAALYVELEGREPVERELAMPLDGDLVLTLDLDS